MFDPGCQFMGDRRVGRLQAAQAGIQFRCDDEIRKLTGKQVDGDERHGHQQDHRYYANEHVSNDQPVAQAPEQPGLERAEGQKPQQDKGDETENPYPSA